MKRKQKKCYNCKHASRGFKWGNTTHHVCKNDPPTDELDHIHSFYDSCENHEFKNVEEIEEIFDSVIQFNYNQI